MTKSMTKPQIANGSFVPGTSRGPRSTATLLLQMAREAEQAEGAALRLRELRGRVPQPEIATKVGVTLRAYQAWEAGKGIAWSNVQKLAEVFGVSEEYILYGPDEDRQPKTQLDRIERKLDTILEHLGLSSPGEPDPAAELEAELAAGDQPSGKRGAGTGSGARVRKRAGR